MNNNLQKKITSFINNNLILYLPLVSYIGPIMKVGSIGISDIYYLLLMIVIIIKIYNKNIIKNIKFFIIFSYILIVFGIILILVSTNTLSSSILVLSWILSGLVITISISLLVNKNNVKLFLNNMLIVYLIIIGLGFYEIITGSYVFPSVFSNQINFLNMKYATSTFGNINDLSYYIVTTLPILVYYCNKSGYKLITFFVIFTGIFFVINSNSYLGYIVIILNLSFLLFLYKKINFRKLFNIKLIVSILFLIPLGFIVSYYFKENILETFNLIIREINNLFQTSSDDMYVDARVEIIRIAINNFKQSNVFIGKGLGYMSSSYNLAMHNLFVTILVEFGLVVFTYFIIILFNFIVKLWKISKYKIDNSNLFINNELALLCLTQMIIFPISSMMPSEALQRKPTWFVLGFALLCINNKDIIKN